MNARFDLWVRHSSRARRYLLGATGGLLIAPPAWLLAQGDPAAPPAADVQSVQQSDSGAAESMTLHSANANRAPAQSALEQPAIQHAGGEISESDGPVIQLAQATRPATATNNEVLRELEKLYRQDGQAMPPMHPSMLPNTVHGPKTEGLEPQVHVRPAQQESEKGGIRGFFRKMNPFARSKPAAQPQPQPAMQARSMRGPAGQPRSLARPYANSHLNPHVPYHQPQVQSRPAVQLTPQPRPQSVALPEEEHLIPPLPRSYEPAPRELPVHVRNEAVENTAMRPLALAPANPPALDSDLGLVETPPPAPAAPAAAIADDLGNPFTELSEAEADGAANPFSGLRLPDVPPAPAASAQPAKREEPSAGPSFALPEAPAALQEDPRLRQIAERPGTGFKGFCPVALRDERELRDADSSYFSVVDGQVFRFSSAEAKAKFDVNPEPYLPAASGNDPVLHNVGLEVAGSLEHAIWFRERLHMFSSAETLAEFIQSIDLDAE